MVMTANAMPFSENIDIEDRWVDREYAKRKLGLR